MDTEIFDLIKKEEQRQTDVLELIPAENYVSADVLRAMGTVLTNKYAEGTPFHRYYGGCQFVDEIEDLARERVKKLFDAEYANVQPHSGAQANMAVYLAILEPGDTVLGLALPHGGHLTHGSPVNSSGKIYNFIQYEVSPKDEQIDYNEIEKIAKKEKPKMITIGASAYSRTIDFKKMAEIAEMVDAYSMADIAHIAGLIAVDLHPSPVPYFDFVTATTHKTLRGPRGGIILCKEKHAKIIDKAVFPGIQGGPLEHVIAAKAVAFGEALKPEFKEYQKQILANVKAFEKAFNKEGLRMVSGGSDNHLLLIDLRPLKLTGKVVQEELDKVNICLNKNTIPFDPESPFVTSGIRLGSPAITSRGMKEDEVEKIGLLISKIIKNIGDEKVYAEVKKAVKEICEKYSVPGIEKHISEIDFLARQTTDYKL